MGLGKFYLGRANRRKPFVVVVVFLDKILLQILGRLKEANDD